MEKPMFHMVRGAPRPVGPFSHATEIDGWVFLTGQMPTDPADDRAPLPAGIEAQTRRVMDNLIAVLGGLDLSLADAVSVRVFLTHFERDYAPMNEAYRSYFPPGKLPARTCVGVTALAVNALVEIDLIARRRAAGSVPSPDGGRKGRPRRSRERRGSSSRPANRRTRGTRKGSPRSDSDS